MWTIRTDDELFALWERLGWAWAAFRDAHGGHGIITTSEDGDCLFTGFFPNAEDPERWSTPPMWGYEQALVFPITVLWQDSGTRACRSCACTDDVACPGGCTWYEYDLCSACATNDSVEWS